MTIERPVRSVPVDRATLVTIAADLADAQGWHELTLSNVAKAVGRHPSSMYAHVASLDDLRQEIALLAVAELSDRVWQAVLGKVGADALLAIAQTYRDFARDFPGRTASISRADPQDLEFAALAERLHQPLQVTFASFGLTKQQTQVAHRIFGATIDGFVRTVPNEDIEQAVGVFLAALQTGTWPAH